MRYVDSRYFLLIFFIRFLFTFMQYTATSLEQRNEHEVLNEQLTSNFDVTLAHWNRKSWAPIWQQSYRVEVSTGLTSLEAESWRIGVSSEQYVTWRWLEAAIFIWRKYANVCIYWVLQVNLLSMKSFILMDYCHWFQYNSTVINYIFKN